MLSPPTLFIVDPDPTACAKIAAIANDLRIETRQYSSAEDFLDTYSAQMPGCLVTEFRLLGLSGIELHESLRANCSALPVIFVTAHPETSFTVKAMQNGALTVLEKPFSTQILWDAVQNALSKDRQIRRIDAKHTELRRRLSALTAKERDVLDLLVEGKTNKVIAKILDISVRTVEARRHHVFRKTGTDSIAQLVRLILQSEYPTGSR
jgi:FixJ family two-component response regulator